MFSYHFVIVLIFSGLLVFVDWFTMFVFVVLLVLGDCFVLGS